MAHPERIQSAIIIVLNWSLPCRCSTGELALDILSIRPPARVVSCCKRSVPRHCSLDMCSEYNQEFLTPGQHVCEIAKSWLLCLVSPALMLNPRLPPSHLPHPQISARTHKFLKENIFFFHWIFHGQIPILFGFLFGIETILSLIWSFCTGLNVLAKNRRNWQVNFMIQVSKSQKRDFRHFSGAKVCYSHRNVRFENFIHMEWSEEKFLKCIVGDKRRSRLWNKHQKIEFLFTHLARYNKMHERVLKYQKIIPENLTIT